MVVNWALHVTKHRSLKCRIEHCNPFRKPAEKFEERQKYRKQLLSLWLSSVSNDMDFIMDWVFFLHKYDTHGIDPNGGMYARATLALLLFTILSTVSYSAGLYQTAFKYPATIQWLAPFTILCEDVPQILLTLVLSGSLGADASAYSAFNIASSLYNALIKLSEEFFLNYCYCFRFNPPKEKDEDEHLFVVEASNVV